MQRVIKIVFLLLLSALLYSCEKDREPLESGQDSTLPAPTSEQEKCPTGRCPSAQNNQVTELEKITVAGPSNPLGKIYDIEKLGPSDKGKEAPESELQAAYAKLDEGPIPKLADSIDLTSVPGRASGIALGDESAKASEKVLAMHKDQRWYLAEIIKPGDIELKIRFFDGEEIKADRRYVRPLLKATEELVVVGDDYLINRNNDGIFHLATVTEHKGQRLEVVYQEDLEHSTVHIKNAVFFSPWPRSAPRAQFGGQPVLAVWNDGRYYSGVTLGIENEMALIRFNDGSEEKLSVDRTRVLIVPNSTLLAPGRITMANRNGRGAYAAAWIIEAQGQMVSLKYLDDGSTETLAVSSLAQY